MESSSFPEDAELSWQGLGNICECAWYEERKDFPDVLPQGVWDKVNVQRFSMKNCGSCEKKCKYYKVRAALKFTDGVVLCNQDFLTQHLMKLRRGQEGLINAAADQVSLLLFALAAPIVIFLRTY